MAASHIVESVLSGTPVAEAVHRLVSEKEWVNPTYVSPEVSDPERKITDTIRMIIGSRGYYFNKFFGHFPEATAADISVAFEIQAREPESEASVAAYKTLAVFGFDSNSRWKSVNGREYGIRYLILERPTGGQRNEYLVQFQEGRWKRFNPGLEGHGGDSRTFIKAMKIFDNSVIASLKRQGVLLDNVVPGYFIGESVSRTARESISVPFTGHDLNVLTEDIQTLTSLAICPVDKLDELRDAAKGLGVYGKYAFMITYERSNMRPWPPKFGDKLLTRLYNAVKRRQYDDLPRLFHDLRLWLQEVENMTRPADRLLAAVNRGEAVDPATYESLKRVVLFDAGAMDVLDRAIEAAEYLNRLSAPQLQGLIEYGKVSESSKPIKENSQQVANEILRQLGGSSRLVAMLGANTFTSHPDGLGGLSFKFPNPSGKPNYCKIVLDPDDTYTMTLGLIRGMNYRVVKEESGLYSEDLKGMFERTTGLRMSL